MNNIKVLNIPIYVGSIQSVCNLLINDLLKKTSSNSLISATGAHGIITSTENEDFHNILSKEFYINLPDGMPLVWIGKLKGFKEMERCYGPDFFAYLISATKHSSIKHFLCGGNEGIADELKEVCEKKFSNKQINGTLCPPFLPVNKYNYESIAEQINVAEPDIIWIGLSTPKQEIFAYNLSKYTKASFIICVGAAFDFHTDKLKQAPSWMQKIGLEWFFRLCMEPKRLYKRYFSIVPKFIYFNVLNLFGVYRNKF